AACGPRARGPGSQRVDEPARDRAGSGDLDARTREIIGNRRHLPVARGGRGSRLRARERPLLERAPEHGIALAPERVHPWREVIVKLAQEVTEIRAEDLGRSLDGGKADPLLAHSLATSTRFECSAGPPPMSATRSSVITLTPRAPAWCLDHQIPSMTARPGRVSSVMVAANLASPRALRTTTASPSAIPRDSASAGWRNT